MLCCAVVIPRERQEASSEIAGKVLPAGGRCAPVLGGEALANELWQAVGVPGVAVQESGFSIRIPEVREPVSCGRCGTFFEVGGPTGFEAELAICDPCLLDGAPLLGVLLALAALTRSFGAFRSEEAEEQRLALMDYGAFARIYEHIAAKEGPARPFFLQGIPSEGQGDGTVAG